MPLDENLDLPCRPSVGIAAQKLVLMKFFLPPSSFPVILAKGSVGVEGNEKANSLAKSAAEGDADLWRDFFPGDNKNEQAFKTPPNHSWYSARKPGGSFQLRPRFHETAFSRFLSGHTSALTF
ncbi:hypothetical protein CEXT_716561 [Caerostris extrusa]|uniref:RNase H type-1 domain-containing protein n=1 Tax=Caerostris extrusa TaxID=172846 RepID=A0AAV4VZ43_CAEEX|nr:hypothetical protein CEXT_716561 [Caerostris extrusa]